MFKENFNKWAITLIADNILDMVGMHVTSLKYWKNRPFIFIKLLNSGTEEENKQLIELNK